MIVASCALTRVPHVCGGTACSRVPVLRDVATVSPSDACRCRPRCTYITIDVDDPATPVPICCCERCDGGWFPPEVSLRMRSCLLADHVTTGRTLCDSMQCRCAWTGDVVYLDDVEKSEMSLMSRDFKGVDLLVCVPLVYRLAV